MHIFVYLTHIYINAHACKEKQENCPDSCGCDYNLIDTSVNSTYIFTHIHAGKNKKTTQVVAVKKLALSKNTDMPALQNEIAMMKTSKHPTVIEYMERLVCVPT
jgi:hypothetical protein